MDEIFGLIWEPEYQLSAKKKSDENRKSSIRNSWQLNIYNNFGADLVYNVI